jgi:hypothetical protein
MGDVGMTKILAAIWATAVLFMMSLAAFTCHAADLSAKAPPLAYPFDSSGFYFGVNTEAAVAQSTVNGSGGLFLNNLATGNLYAAGGGVGGSVGWIKSNPNGIWFALQATATYQNISADVVTPGGSAASVASRWAASQVVKVGGFSLASFTGPLQSLGVNFPTFQLPAAPNGISVAATSKPYVMAGIAEQGVSGSFGVLGGSTWSVAPLIGAGTLTPIIDSTGKPTGAALDIYAQVIFANRGVQVTNVFGTAGAPMAGFANLDKTYKAGVGVYW